MWQGLTGCTGRTFLRSVYAAAAAPMFQVIVLVGLHSLSVQSLQAKPCNRSERQLFLIKALLVSSDQSTEADFTGGNPSGLA